MSDALPATCMEQENDINHTDKDRFTPLMWAGVHRQIAVVEFLLQKGTGPQLLARGRETTLSLACTNSYIDIVKVH